MKKITKELAAKYACILNCWLTPKALSSEPFSRIETMKKVAEMKEICGQKLFLKKWNSDERIVDRTFGLEVVK